MQAVPLNAAAEAHRPPTPTSRGFVVHGDALSSRRFGRVRRSADGAFVAPLRPTGVVIVPEGVSLSARRLAAALECPGDCPYPAWRLEPPHVFEGARLLSVAALAAACLYGVLGGFVGIAVPALTTVSSVYYGGDAFSGTAKFQAIVDIVARREIKLGYEKDKMEEDRAFSAEIRRLAP